MCFLLRFGRYTVAALEAKIHQYERDTAQLRRALERSDKYIEELEARDQRDGPRSEEGALAGTASGGTQDGGVERITLMRRSLSQMEETSVCTDLDREPTRLPSNHACLLTTSDACQRVDFLGGPSTPPKDVAVLSTPSSALRSLSLKSPGVCSDRKLGLKPLTYLRRLSFDDCQSSSSSVNQSPRTFQVNTGASLGQNPSVNSDKDASCMSWMDRRPELPQLDGNGEKFKRSENTSSAEDPAGNSEACMDAAYLDKISELDSMMADGESSSGQVSQLPSAFDAAQIPELDFCSNLIADPGTARENQATSATQENTDDAANTSEEKVSFVDFALEHSGQSTKRKCPTGSDISSPSKLSKLK